MGTTPREAREKAGDQTFAARLCAPGPPSIAVPVPRVRVRAAMGEGLRACARGPQQIKWAIEGRA